ncbi:hypothetical protein FZI93_27645 [Mycobacterium sp. CBMA361]|nr:hypothetical protein [Mycolicibacterium sp. CBMA 361]
MAVEPVTATLPVAPFSVHSGVPPLGASVVGQVRSAAVAVAALSMGVTEEGVVVTSGACVVVAAGLVSDPHPVRVTASDAAAAARATEEETREKFTVVTLPGHHPRGAIASCAERPPRSPSRR